MLDKVVLGSQSSVPWQKRWSESDGIERAKRTRRFKGLNPLFSRGDAVLFSRIFADTLMYLHTLEKKRGATFAPHYLRSPTMLSITATTNSDRGHSKMCWQHSMGTLHHGVHLRFHVHSIQWGAMAGAQYPHDIFTLCCVGGIAVLLK